MKKAIFSLLLVLPLYGCVPAAAVAVGATAGGAILYDKRSFTTMRSDQHATNLAQYRINNDSAIKGRAHISVAVFDKIGLLVGQAQSSEIREKAYALMKEVKGIDRVYNAVTVQGASSKVKRANDAYLTAKVRTALLTTGGLKSNDIKVVTEDSVAYLLGAVSREQADLATKAARHVAGIAKVVKVFQYT